MRHERVLGGLSGQYSGYGFRKLTSPIYLALSYDEEVGCLGAPDLAETIAQKAGPIDAVIVGEPSQMNVIEQHKGAMAGRVQFHGIDAHSSLPQLGVSATRAAADFATRIVSLEAALQMHQQPLSWGVRDGFTVAQRADDVLDFTSVVIE